MVTGSSRSTEAGGGTARDVPGPSLSRDALWGRPPTDPRRRGGQRVRVQAQGLGGFAETQLRGAAGPKRKGDVDTPHVDHPPRQRLRPQSAKASLLCPSLPAARSPSDLRCGTSRPGLGGNTPREETALLKALPEMTNCLKCSSPTLRGSGAQGPCALPTEGADTRQGPRDPHEVLRACVRGPCGCTTPTPGFLCRLCRWARCLGDTLILGTVTSDNTTTSSVLPCQKRFQVFHARTLILSPTAPNVGTIVTPL